MACSAEMKLIFQSPILHFHDFLEEEYVSLKLTWHLKMDGCKTLLSLSEGLWGSREGIKFSKKNKKDKGLA